MFERELDYYGIAPAEPQITSQRSILEIAKEFRDQFRKEKAKHDMFSKLNAAFSAKKAGEDHAAAAK